NEPRDLYDLWHLVSHGGIDLASLVPAIAAKLAFRNVEPAGIQEAIMKKEARLKALWSVRLANQMSALPPFDQVFRESRRIISAASQRCPRRSEPPSPSGARLAARRHAETSS